MRAIAAGVVVVAAASAWAQDAAKPAEKPPDPGPIPEIVGPDAIKRPNGLVVRYYRVNFVSADILARQLEAWLPKEKGTLCAEGPSTVPPGGAAPRP